MRGRHPVSPYRRGNKVAINVGYYYMANACGRLTGTILSGALYSYVGDDVSEGLAACFGASVVFIVVSTAVTYWIDDDDGGLRWGKSLACCGAEPWVDEDKTAAAAVVEEGGVGR